LCYGGGVCEVSRERKKKLIINFKMIHHLFVTVYSVYLLMSSAGVLVFSALPDDSVLSTKLFSN